MEKIFGPRRCRDSRKPQLIECPDVHFYRSPLSQEIFYNFSFPNQVRKGVPEKSLESMEAKSVEELAKLGIELAM